jgi:type IV pilus assembly protein PilM
MLKFLRNKTYPIGIDLGASSLKMMQLAATETGLALVAAARAEVPDDIRGDASSLHEWYVRNIKTLLGEKPFRGRRAVTCLPARELLVQHLRVAKMDESQLGKALVFEAQDKVPFNIHHALLRHVVAGEIYEGSETKLEVIVMAASRLTVEQHLNLIQRTKLEIGQVNVEPCALINCFAHLLREQAGAVMFVDIGQACSKVVVCQGASVVFSRIIPLAADQMQRALSTKLSVSGEHAQHLLNTLEKQVEPLGETVRPEERGGATRAGAATLAPPSARSITAVLEPIWQNLCEEIRGCVRYHDLLFNARQVERVIFVGGQAKNTFLCQQLARGLRLPAQLADPLARVSPETRLGPHSDLEAGQRHCDWAVAFGLSLSGSEDKTS